jgi:hypothetical protein
MCRWRHHRVWREGVRVEQFWMRGDMTYGTDTLYDLKAYDRGRSSRKALPQNIFGGVALGCIALACAWTMYANLAPANVSSVAAALPPAAPAEPAVTREQIAAALKQAAATQAIRSTYAALLNPSYSLGPPPGTFVARGSAGAGVQVAEATPQDDTPTTQSVLPGVRQLAQIVPVPAPRPSELRLLQSRSPSPSDVAQANKAAVLATVTPEKPPTIFEKLFGKPQPYRTTLAYAAPDGGVFSDGQSTTPGRSPLYDRSTAVYDISAHMVYMPDGTKLEAHSGLGSMLDDPRYADRKMRGVTPPHTYDLTLRESLFHGVQALRLTPVGGEGNIYGRSGLLAHTYMLGPNGDSNGCVSFRNYEAFLRAYKSGDIKRLVVVARL